MIHHLRDSGVLWSVFVSLARPVSAGTCPVTLGLGMDLTGSSNTKTCFRMTAAQSNTFSLEYKDRVNDCCFRVQSAH